MDNWRKDFSTLDFLYHGSGLEFLLVPGSSFNIRRRAYQTEGFKDAPKWHRYCTAMSSVLIEISKVGIYALYFRICSDISDVF